MSANKRSAASVGGNVQNNKRAKTDDKKEAEDSFWLMLHYNKPLQTMIRLAKTHWNLLDTDGCGYVYEYGPERDSYLSDMETILSGNSSSYENPFGADDREEFTNTFEDDLTRQEQKFFLELAKKNRMTMINITEIEDYFLKKVPFAPLYVDLSKKGGSENDGEDEDDPFEDGSERFPYSSESKAYAKYKSNGGFDESKHRPVFRFKDELDEIGEVGCLKVTCGADCEKKSACCFPKCGQGICKIHGEGVAIDDKERGEWTYLRYWCQVCSKMACRMHEHKRFHQCDVCSGEAAGAASLMDELPDPDKSFLLCKRGGCGVKCTKLDEEGDPCQFFCCPRCLKDHTCNITASDYC